MMVFLIEKMRGFIFFVPCCESGVAGATGTGLII